MAQRKPGPKPAPTPPEDPLADLRDADEPGPPTVPGNGQEPEDQGPDLHGEVRPMVTQELWDEMVSEAVASWHQDPTSQGFLHGGGQCGCLYIARHALRAAVPVMTEEDMEERTLEPADG